MPFESYDGTEEELTHVMTDKAQAEHVFVKDGDNSTARRPACRAVVG